MTNLEPTGHVHPATDTEAANGQGTQDTSTSGETLDHPVLDGASEYYGAEREARDPRHGQDDPALIRHPETGEKTATPENL